MQKIAILGGTGMTGQCAVEHAVKKGLHVKLLYRNEATIPENFYQHKHQIDLIKGDATNRDDVKNLLTDVDGVCIILGTRNDLNRTSQLSIGTKNVLDTMKEKNLKIVSAVMSSFLFWEDSKIPPQFLNINNEHREMLELLKSSGLDYIAILPPHISSDPAGDFDVVYDGSPPGRVISKYDLGKFIIDSLESPQHYGRICGIAQRQ